MMIIWDEPKREANLAKHGLDFAAFEDLFDFVAAIELAAAPSRMRTERRRFAGVFDGRLVAAAILSPLGAEAFALISLRPASREERRLYAEA